MTPTLEVRRAAGLVTVQDAGRPGAMHLGIPPGGPLVPRGLARANVAAGNASGCAALEIVGRLELVARAQGAGRVRVADDQGNVHTLRDGESLTLASAPSTRVRYLAVAGGVATPLAHGGRGTLLVAGIGGHEGRVLRRGDRLPIGGSDADRSEVDPSLLVAPSVDAEGTHRVRVVLGPDAFPPEAVAVLLGGVYAVTAAMDRTGVRLDGPQLRVPETADRSTPMAMGAIQVPPTGQPIVLGPDHPTTGGYPVIAVVVRADAGDLFGSPPGARLRFSADDLNREASIASPPTLKIGGASRC